MSVLKNFVAFIEHASAPPVDAVTYFLKALSENRIAKYKKFGNYVAEIATKRQRVITFINGVKETENEAQAGDYILTGPQGERYVLKPNKLKERYKKIGEDLAGRSIYKAIGECWAIQYHGKPFTFTAPWGEEMICNSGDYICSTKTDGTDVYRIDQNVFLQTYKKA